MQDAQTIGAAFHISGFAVVPAVFSPQDLRDICAAIDNATGTGPAFRRTASVYAIRRFLKEIPAAVPLVLTPGLTRLLAGIFGPGYNIVKSIYFDKPGDSNWAVSWHQDLTIAVREKIDAEGFGPWTVKGDVFAVQPPLPLLQDNFTVRIHLDDTDGENGALQVLPGSHRTGIRRALTDGEREKAVICAVPAAGIMLMHPLLLHASGKSTGGRQRRVIHIEFSKAQLPAPLQWAEYLSVQGA
jgi:ectoine hydroxylase-related dioxygenase (phytanoyl-CoA dioxygenase family)